MFAKRWALKARTIVAQRGLAMTSPHHLTARKKQSETPCKARLPLEPNRVNRPNLDLHQPPHHPNTVNKMADEFDDDVFDDIDEADLVELERPAKRQKVSVPVTAAEPDDSAHLTLAKRILKDNFGYETFRHEQAGVIESLMAGENALAVFPTGAGKSLCYQVRPSAMKLQGLEYRILTSSRSPPLPFPSSMLWMASETAPVSLLLYPPFLR